MTTVLPDAFDLNAVRAYLRATAISEDNLNACMRVIEKLTTGQGITHRNKPGEAFLIGYVVTPNDNLVMLRQLGAVWLPYRKSNPHRLDRSNGWALDHPLGKLIQYKNHLLSGP